jgi:AcrR family transcriptional regulator
MGAVNRPVQERILGAADRLFYRQGIRAVGVDAIAGEAGVSKRTLYSYYRTKDELVAAYLTGRFKLIPPSDAPAREQILGYFDRLERLFSAGDFRGCPYVNAVTELGDRKHAATEIAVRFKEQRLEWYRTLLVMRTPPRCSCRSSSRAPSPRSSCARIRASQAPRAGRPRCCSMQRCRQRRNMRRRASCSSASNNNAGRMRQHFSRSVRS